MDKCDAVQKPTAARSPIDQRLDSLWDSVCELEASLIQLESKLYPARSNPDIDFERNEVPPTDEPLSQVARKLRCSRHAVMELNRLVCILIDDVEL